jgi:hypothetical protein
VTGGRVTLAASLHPINYTSILSNDALITVPYISLQSNILPSVRDRSAGTSEGARLAGPSRSHLSPQAAFDICTAQSTSQAASDEIYVGSELSPTVPCRLGPFRTTRNQRPIYALQPRGGGDPKDSSSSDSYKDPGEPEHVDEPEKDGSDEPGQGDKSEDNGLCALADPNYLDAASRTKKGEGKEGASTASEHRLPRFS